MTNDSESSCHVNNLAKTNRATYSAAAEMLRYMLIQDVRENKEINAPCCQGAVLNR